MKAAISAEKLRKGDEREFTAFYKEYYSLFMAFAYKFLTEKEAARDVVQDVFMDYLKRRHLFQEIIQIKVFFYRSIRNTCINIITHRKTHEKFVDLEQHKEIETTEFFYSTIVREEISFIIHNEIKHLPPAARQVLLLVLEGKSNDEIAAELSISVNTVKTHKARSYSILRKQLSELLSLFIILG